MALLAAGVVLVSAAIELLAAAVGRHLTIWRAVPARLASMKRMVLRRPIASSIGTLWTEAMPKAVVTPQAARNSATRSPTV